MEPLTKEYLLVELSSNLDTVQKWQEEVAGQWDGKESGLQEEASQLAVEIVEAIRSLRSLLNELNESF